MRGIGRFLLVAAALFVFILGLQTLKKGAGGVMPVLEGLSIDGVLNSFGLGWLLAYVVLSGSPVAAVSLTLFASRQISDVETLGMVAGSRFGAAFVVLLVGTIYYLRRRGTLLTVATGVLCLLVTWSVYLPATILGYVMLQSGLLDGARMPVPQSLGSLIDSVFGPLVALAAGALHPFLLFVTGVLVLLASFTLFDRALPNLTADSQRFRQIAFVVYRTHIMFLLGVVVTCVTLSVSVSLGLLVPLSAKGYVRRENIVPYIMGANISTFLDTLVAALLVGEPRAFSVVLAELIGVSVVSLIILFGFYRSYRDGLEWCLEGVTRNRRTFFVFTGLTLLVPVLLMLL